MSSSFIFMGATDEQNPTRKSSSKPHHKETLHNKKPRQRGMGVEKLERLRIEEKWKEINNIHNNITTTTTTPAYSSSSSLPPYGFMPPSTVFPNVAAAGGGGGGLNNLISPVGFSNSQNVVGCTSQGLLQQQLHSDHDKLQGCQYLCRAADVYKGAKVVALHMKENKSGGNFLMEYDFFPSSRTHKELVGGGQLESDNATALSIGIGGCAASVSASCVTTTNTSTTTTAEDDASTFIDLSLKLSY